MNAYYNISDFINNLNICKAFKRGNLNFSREDYLYAKQYLKEFMQMAWKRAKRLKAGLKEAFRYIRYRMAADFSTALKTLKTKLRKLRRTNTTESELRRDNPIVMKLRKKRYWDKLTGFTRQEPIFYGSKYNFNLN